MKRITAIILSACLLVSLIIPPMISAYEEDIGGDNLAPIEHITEESVVSDYAEDGEVSEIYKQPNDENSVEAEDIQNETDTADEAEDASGGSDAADKSEDITEESNLTEESEDIPDDSEDIAEKPDTAEQSDESSDETDAKDESEESSDEPDSTDETEDTSGDKPSEEESESIDDEADALEENEDEAEEEEIEEEELAEAIKIHIELDEERNVTVTATAEIAYLIIDEDENEKSDILVIFKLDDETNISQEDISVSLPAGWNWKYKEDADDADDAEDNSKDITIIFYKTNISKKARTQNTYFDQNEIDDPDMWYTEADTVITLEETPANDVYTRLRGLIQSAEANKITHILIPFHINTGNITTTGVNSSIVRVPDGATVVLIGVNPDTSDGQVIISNTSNNISQTFRVRGNNTERCALVLRNVAVQRAASSTQTIPATPPNPLSTQLGTSRGGGVAIEGTDGGGGHLVLCRGGEIRNASTNENGVVDVQSGRFTMMKDSFVRDNVASNSGGGVNVEGSNAVFNMYGGTIRNNHAKGEETDNKYAYMRAVGGGVFVQNSGTFNMYDGEILENNAQLDGIVTAANAIVTSSGGGVFVTGANSTFTMHGGSISNNRATRTRSSNIPVGPTRRLFRAGNGGGVFLNEGASFIMHDGYIKGNIASAERTTAVITDGEALNLSNGGGVYLAGAGTTFYMHYGTIAENHAIRVVNSVVTSTLAQMMVFAGNGGGVFVYNNAVFTMDDGKISENTATASGGDPVHNTTNLVGLANGGGVFAGGTALVADTENGMFIMNGGVISGNRALGRAANSSAISGNGGGVSVMTRSSFIMTGGLISGNVAEDGNTTTTTTDSFRRGNGAGVYLRGTGNNVVFDMSGGEISGHRDVTNNGVGVFISNGRMEYSGTALIENNHSPKHGGGIYVDGTATLNMNGGTINKNTAAENGGGIFLSSTNVIFNMGSGSITNNIANDGGGLFVPHLNLSSNLSRVTIDPPAEFSGNVARNGVRIDNALAAATRQRIRPGTVSVAWVETNPTGSGTFADGTPHPFTNYDINANGPRFWRVTYAAGGGEGVVTAQIGSNRHPVASGYFAPESAEISFVAQEANMFDRWELGSRPREKNDDGSEVAFSFETFTGTPLSHVIAAHTHAIGHFQGVQSIKLTVSKTVEGALGNLNEQFEFSIIFKEADGNPLAQGREFKYTGDVIEDSGASPLENGGLILDDTGSATFKLGHGQVIIIDDVPEGTYVQIIEKTGSAYSISFIDSENPDVVVSENDTTSLLMTKDRTFAFTNRRNDVPVTGINTGNITAALLLPVLLSISALTAFTVRTINRERRKRKVFTSCGTKTPFRV